MQIYLHSIIIFLSRHSGGNSRLGLGLHCNIIKPKQTSMFKYCVTFTEVCIKNRNLQGRFQSITFPFYQNINEKADYFKRSRGMNTS